MSSNLRLLGTPSAEVAGKVSDLQLDKPASLLFYLARRGDWVSRSELAFLYRPDAPESVALGNVRVYLHRAKERFWAENLELEKSRVRFRVNTDVIAFESALARRAWPQALTCYRGLFLAGMNLHDVPGYETWLELERQDLAQKRRTAAFNYAHDLEQQQDFRGAQGQLEQLRHADPLDEDCLQAYLRVLFAAGKRKQALDVYQVFRRDLLRELDIEPLGSTTALFETLRRAEPETLPIPTPPKLRHNLPAQTTRFIGRKHDLAQLAETLAEPDCRLLTLVGLGGVGKTRLALELAAGQLETYPDGVWFVPLAGVASAELLVPGIATALQFNFSGASDPKEQLENFLRDKDLLLLLDNFEQLLAGAVLLEELLETAPKLKIVVTSRVALELRAEGLFDVHGLAYPPADTKEPLDSFDAVKLFNSRAERLSATFVPQGETLEAVAELTRKVEGLPLALELAAAWTRTLSVPQLLAELDRNLELLSGQLRDLPERHRSLRTVFDYSWQRLSEKEQEALAKLSIFQGGFTLEAAEEVAGVHLALLLSLINHSLVRRNQKRRFTLHTLIQQYATRRLKPDAERAIRNRHLLFFTNLMRQMEPQISGAEQVQVKARLRDETDNFQDALAWGFTHRPEVAVKLTAYLGRYWESRGLVQEGEPWLLRALALYAKTPTDIRAKLQLKSLSLAVIGGNSRQIEKLQETALTLCVEAGDAFEAEYNNLAGWAATNQRRFNEARALLERGLLLAKRAENDWLERYLLLNLGVLADRQNNLVVAHAHYQTCLDLACACGDTRLNMIALCNMAGHRLVQGEFEAASIMSNEALELAYQVDDQVFEAVIKGNLGYATWHCGRHEEGERLYREHLLLLCAQGNIGHFFENVYDLANFWSQLGLTKDAICLWGAAENLQRVFGYPLPESAHDFHSDVLGAVGEAERDALLLVGAAKSTHDLLKLLRAGGVH